VNDTLASPHRILVPLDGSDLAEQVLDLASEIARRLGGSLILISVPEVYGLEPAWYGGATLEAGAPIIPIDEFMTESRHEAAKYLGDRKADLERRGVSVATIIGEESPAESIAHTAESQDVVLVAMASHGRRGISRWAFGSVADKVLHITSRPVLIVRSATRPAPTTLSHILVALDGSALAEAVLPWAELLARAFGAHLTLAHVTVEVERMRRPDAILAAEREHAERMSRYLEDVAERLRNSGLEATAESLEGEDITTTLLTWQEAHGSDLIALTTHGRAGLRHLAFGCIADRVLQTATTPVLLQRIAEG
jgi:nucleotide-binding universal stress UspA family protein